MATNLTDADLERTYLYHQLDEYPWQEDEEFQGGLRAILGSVQDPAQVDHLTLRAKCYYYARKAGVPVDFEGYRQWVDSLHSGVPSNGAAAPIDMSYNHQVQSQVNESEGDGGGVGGIADAPKPASFAEICDMIAEGKPIPGIKDIPDTILEGEGTESQVGRRKKPWEKDSGSGSEEKPSWMT